MVTSSKERSEAGTKKLKGSRASARVGSEGMLPEGELSIAKGPNTAGGMASSAFSVERMRLEQ